MANKNIPQLTEKQSRRFIGSSEQCPIECLEWIGNKLTDGRGRIHIEGSFYLVSRVAYAHYYGKDPSELCVCHKCDNPKCINPKHLFLGTHQDNMMDKAVKMRGCTKLTPEKVVEIRRCRADGLTYGQLKIKFKVEKGVLHKIVNRQTWKFVE